MSRWWLLLCLPAAVATAQEPDAGPSETVERPPAEVAAASPEAEAEARHVRSLSVLDVVSLAKKQSPSLRAALLDVENARYEVLANEALYDAVLQLDATGSQLTTPSAFATSVRRNRVRRGEAGAELRKHFLWGTDLSLRVATNLQKSQFLGGIAFPTTGGTTGMGVPPGIGSALGFGTFGPLYGLTAKLTLKQPLWRGRGREVNQASLRAARAQQTGSEHSRARASSELLRDVLTAYWELWYADSALHIQRQSRDVAARQRDEAVARVRSGSLAPAEALSFETQTATRDEDVLSAENERDRRVHELARLLGSELDEAYGVASEPALDDRRYARAQVEQTALAEAAELRERSAAVELAQLRARTADDPKKPRLDLDGYVQAQGLGNKNYGDAAEMFVTGEAISALATLTYEAPLRDRARRAEAAKARIAVQIAEEQLREARQRVLAEVRNALDREASGRKRIALSEQTANIAAQQLSAEQARYRTGSATSIAVVEAEDRVRSAELRLARARADYAECVLVLEHLTGELLARHAD